jgi:hypothetical protein
MLLPHFVAVPYTLSMLLGYCEVESGGVIDDDTLLSRRGLLYCSRLSTTTWLRRFLGATR